MVKIIWMPTAIQDLNDISAYIAKDSVRYSDIWLDGILARTEALIGFPRLGRIVPEKKDPDLRELIEGNYRIIYQIKSSTRVEVLTVRHSARQLKL